MKSILTKHGYHFDDAKGIWRRPEFDGIAYSDGDEVENRLFDIIKNTQDVSVLSDELKPHCTDWPSLYHLSSSRANILRPFEKELTGDILEIGAGCGAITRYLGECGANVLALEGTPRRAMIARSRTRDLENVTVLNEKFENFKIDKQFDVITLIGVLEYANLFTSSETPAVTMLGMVKKLLKPDGKLIIAIENQLGLKYFAGAPEDHIGQAMYGIEGRYTKNQPQTYGRKVLNDMLVETGFGAVEFLAPFPDYKLPVSIITERGFCCDTFDAAAFAWQSVSRDPQLPQIMAFSSELVWPTIFKNKLALDLANSFLIVASPNKTKDFISSKKLAWHFTTSRRKHLCKLTEFVEVEANQPEVFYKRLNPNALNPVMGNLLQNNLPKRDEYRSGILMSQEFIHVMSQNGWHIDDFCNLLRNWLKFLATEAAQHGQHLDLSKPFTQLPGNFFDYSPQNIIISSNKDLHIIDKEWVANDGFEIAFLIFRFLMGFLDSFPRFARAENEQIKTYYDLICLAMKGLGWSVSHEDFVRYLDFENRIQFEVVGSSVTIKDRMARLKSKVVTVNNLNQALSERENRIDNLNQALTHYEIELNSIITSKSWFITRPLRWLKTILREDILGVLNPIRILKPMSRDINNKGYSLIVTSGLTNAPIDPVVVIVPVYRGVEMTRRCIESAMPGVLAVPGALLLAINDDSPDQGMDSMLESLKKLWPNRIEVLHNISNLGFVQTVNRGLKLFPDHDIVMLNSDVLVPLDWLERLRSEAYSRRHVGTVTPLSNNATICSFPNFLEENDLPFGLDVNAIDAVFRQKNLPCIEAPTGVGFCMYVRRECLNEIGYLDEKEFGRGYGEENDLCQRALKKGWFNLISPNIFVFHEGSVSFSNDKQKLVSAALCTIEKLHPNYHADVQRFIEKNSIKPARIIRYAHLLGITQMPKVLHIMHSLGGGTKQHIQELSQYLTQNMAHIFMEPKGIGDVIQISFGLGLNADSMTFSMSTEYDKLLKLLKSLGISAVHFHHTLGYDQKILGLAEHLDASRILTIHDYYWLCGNSTLTDQAGIYSDTWKLNLNSLFLLPDGVTEAHWQKTFGVFVESADLVIFPSHATKSIYEDFYKPINAVVAPHIEKKLNIKAQVRRFIKKPHYKIGILGAIGREKGADFLEEIAIKAKQKLLNFNFKIIGYSYRPLKQVEITGPYNVENLSGLINQNDFDIIFFPARCPETYSYTLSNALNSGLPIVAPNIGAFPERLSGRFNTLIYNNLDTADSLISKLKNFIYTIERGESISAPVFKSSIYKQNFYDHDYPKAVALNIKNVQDSDELDWVYDDLMRRPHLSNKGLWRESLAYALWRLRMNPSLRFISNAIPPSIRKKIRLSLSGDGMDNISRKIKSRQ